MPNFEASEKQDEGLDVAVPSQPRPAIAAIAFRTKARQSERTQNQAPLTSRLLLALHRLQLGILKLIEEEAAYGRAILLAPIYMGVGAIFWFEAGSDPPPQGVLAGLLVFTAAFALMREAGKLFRHLLFTGMLLCLGMTLAQWESWRASTTMLDSAVTTTVAGQVERRESYENGRWRYVVRVEATESRPFDARRSE